MRRSLALIPAMALVLAAQTAAAQQGQPGQQPVGGERVEQPGAIEAPQDAARQELEVQDTDTGEMDGAGDVDIVPQGGAPAAQLNGRGPADVPAQDFAAEAQRQPASPPLPEDPLAHLNRTAPQPGQISQPADTGMAAEAQAGGEPQPMPAPQGPQDPVPLPDVPEAVAEELRDDNVKDVKVPPEVGQPPQPANAPPPAGNPAPAGNPQPQRQ